MAPRKDGKAPKKVAKKKPKTRQKKVKPVLKTPSIVKVKLLKFARATTTNDDSGNEHTVCKDVNKAVNVTKANTSLKTPNVKKKNVNEGLATARKVPVKKKCRAKASATKSTTVGAIKEDAKYDTKIEANYYKNLLANNVVNLQFPKKPKHLNEQSIELKLQANKPVINTNSLLNKESCSGPTLEAKKPVKMKKCGPIKKASKINTSQDIESKNDITLQGTIREDAIIYDRPKVEANYYKILLANDVVNLRFPKKPKHLNEQSIELKLQENKPVTNTNSLLKTESTSGPTPEAKKPVKIKKCGPIKKASKINTSQDIECKNDITSKEVDINMDNTKNHVQKSRQKKVSNTTSLRKSSKAKLKDNNYNNMMNNTENVKAGPNQRKVLNKVKKQRKICNRRKLVTKYTKQNESVENCRLKKFVNNSMEKASIISNKSLTKQISCTSNSSFVKVDPSCLYYFDSKVPVVHLNENNNNLNINQQMLLNSDNITESTRDVVEYGVIKETMNETDKQYCPPLGLKYRSLASGTLALSSDETKFDFCSSRNRLDNNSLVGEENVVDVEHTSSRLSTSSTSCSNSSLSGSSTCTTYEDLHENLTNGMNSERNFEDTLERKSVSINIDMNEVLQRLNINIEKCEMNIVKLSQKHITYEKTNNEMNVKNLQDNVFRSIKEETIMHCCCQCTTQLDISDVDKYFNHSKCHETANISCSKTPEICGSKDKSPTLNEHVNRNDKCKKNIDMDQQFGSDTEVDTVAAKEIEKIDSNCNLAHKSFGDNDDDDTLSLYAESLTGLESYRRNSTFNSEEYVPQPVVAHSRTSISYQPTKISECTSICEKQKADSTSLLNDSCINHDIPEITDTYEDRTGSFSQSLSKLLNIVTKNSPMQIKPRLMASNHFAVQGLKSLVFKGYCFFYFISNCKRTTCAFLHEYPNVYDVKNILGRLTEDLFIEEYMHVRNVVSLRRKYGLCFVYECIRRKLTRILVEMAIDFIVKSNKNLAEDNALKSEAVDNILIYLNQVDLSVCGDLLQYTLKCENKLMLCDYFMRVIATSQNFSRFKPIFINLTDFIYRIGWKFSVDVADSIIERFCILPYDDLLAQSLLKLLVKTDGDLLTNSNLDNLERQLLVSNSDLHQELQWLKKNVLASRTVLDNRYGQVNEPHYNTNVDRINTNFRQTDKNIVRYSPDTTDMGIAITPPLETTVKRTVHIGNLRRTGFDNKINAYSKSISGSIGFNPVVNEPTQSGGLSIGHTANTISSSAVENVQKRKWTNCHDSVKSFKRNRIDPIPALPQRAPLKRHSDWSLNSMLTNAKRINDSNHYQRDLL